MDNEKIISSNDLAAYVVCPEAWRLKLTNKKYDHKPSPQQSVAKEIRKEWQEEQELSSSLSLYARITYFLLTAIVALVFILEHYRSSFLEKLHFKTDIHIPDEILLLLIFLGLVIFMWDFFQRKSKKIKKEGGLSPESTVKSIKGSKEKPVDNYFSNKLGLSAKPDAVVKEMGLSIPVIVKPTTNKIRDRHVIELLNSLVLLEEKEKKPIPYGLLLMGKDKRRVEIEFNEEKRKWHSMLVAEMRSILDGVPAVPKPSFNKCKRCDVAKICDHSEAGSNN